MKTRKELERTYKKIWHIGSGAIEPLDNFCIFLEEFLDFSKHGFFQVKKEYEGSGRLTYHSKSVWVEISPDFERFVGMTSRINFFYARPNRFDIPYITSPDAWCRHFILSKVDTSMETYWYSFLDDIPVENAPKEFSKLPVFKFFEQKREADTFLSQLSVSEPAYGAAFEAFCWEYYGDRFWSLFAEENQSIRDDLALYAYEYYKLNYPREAFVEMEKRKYIRPYKKDGKIVGCPSPPPWKLCL